MRPPNRLGLALGVALGGVLLGALLGAAADPKMKNLPQASWAGARPEPGTELAYAPEGVAIYELASYPDRYAPPFPDEAIADWAPDFPGWTYSDFGSDFSSDFDDEAVEPLPDERAAEVEPQPLAEPEVLPPEPPGEGSLAALY